MLREAMVDAFRSPARRLRRSSGHGFADDSNYFWALRNVSFEVAPGEVVGIIGRNGAGKSTLLKILSRITEPTEGSADVWGLLGSLLEVGTGFHPELTGRENVFLNGAILGMRKAEVERKFDEIVAFAGVEEFIDTPVKRYSSGMSVRLAFAVAAHLEPDILLVDEVLAVGDHEFQRRCLGKMEDVSSEGRTVMFISHSMPAVLRLCPRVILLDHGEIVTDGPARDVVKVYLESGLGTTAAREWASVDTAPGDDYVRLRSVRALNSRGEISEEASITEPIEIEVDYWLCERVGRDSRTCVVLEFWNEDGVLLFASTNINDLPDGIDDRPGSVRARCRIPGNLLAEGQVLVKVVLVSSRPTLHHVAEGDVVAFHVVDPNLGDSVRGSVGGNWPGVLRPMLGWTTERAPEDDQNGASRHLA